VMLPTIQLDCIHGVYSEDNGAPQVPSSGRAEKNAV
jgi:hypothetical protein